MGENADEAALRSAAGESGNTGINTRNSEDHDHNMKRDSPACGVGEETILTALRAPLAEPVFRHEIKNSRENESRERPAELDADNSSNNPGLHAEMLHGQPITISQCVFQAHIGRVNTVAEAREVSEAVSTMTEREAAPSEFVGPFAYRLACVGEGGGARPPRNIGDDDHKKRHAPEKDHDDAVTGSSEQEGYCDNGDVGSGEKLLHLLQKWDVRRRVLMVTRINGGFVMAELLGVRRYKFVIDRAKKMLESTDLLSLRRAVDADIHPQTTAEANVNLAAHEAAVAGRDGGPLLPARNQYHRHRLAGCNGVVGVGGGSGSGGGGSGPVLEDGWDQFVVPLSARRRISGHTAYGGNLLGAPRANGGGVIVIPPQRNGGGGGGGRGGKIRTKAETFSGGWLLGESTRTRERRALSLSQLSISSKTIPFPRGHVPSIMGMKGHGKKRGRINHFAVRTPPPSPSGMDDGDDGKGGCRRDGRGAGAVLHGSLDSMTSSWSLSHELDPTSTITSLEGTTTVKREASGGANNNISYSIHTAAESRVSTCDTINSPSRVAAIMLGVASGVHKALPPPYINGSDGRDGSSNFSGEFSSSGSVFSPTAYSSDLDVDASDPSIGGGAGCARRARQQALLPAGAYASGKSSADGGGAWSGGKLSHCPIEGDGGAVAALGGGSSFSSGAAAGQDSGTHVAGIDGCVFPPAVGVGGTGTGTGGGNGGGGGGDGGGGGGGSNRSGSSTGGYALPLLHRALGTGVRDGSPPPIADVAGDVGGGGTAAAVPPPLSNDSTIGRWKNDDDGNSSISTSGGVGGDVARAGDGPATNASGEEKSPQNRTVSRSRALVNPDQSLARTMSSTIAPEEGTDEGDGGGEGGERRKECDTPVTWGSDDHLGSVSGESDHPPTRSKSALRGWSVGRAVPACSPLETAKRKIPSKKR